MKKEWEDVFSNLKISEQILDFNKQTPENFIDDIKIKYLQKHLPKEGIIFEIGAGSGRLLTRVGIINNKFKLIGIKENILKFNLNGVSIQANAYNIPLKSNNIDAIISGGFLEHFNEEEIDKILQEIKRVLKDGGIFYAEIVPNKKSLCRPIILTKAGGYENDFNKKKWIKIMEKNNFKNIKVVSGIVIPPNFFCWFKSGILLKITYKFKYLIEHIENTFISDIFGFSYYVTAEK